MTTIVHTANSFLPRPPAQDYASLSRRPSSPTPPPPPPPAKPSVIAYRSTTGLSLYQDCRTALELIAQLPSAADYLRKANEEASDTDPLHILWQFCRIGDSLCMLFNELPGIKQKLKVNHSSSGALSNTNARKASVYHFIIACRDQLRLPEEVLFRIGDVFQDDTNGFVKVVNTLNVVLQKLQESGVIRAPLVGLGISRAPAQLDTPLSTPSTAAGSDPRSKVIVELRTTELRYVQDLERLQRYMHALSTHQILPPDKVFQIFSNLNEIVDFQRRFLVGIESNADKPPREQRFGELFIRMEGGFGCYQTYCSNYDAANETALAYTTVLKEAELGVEPGLELPSLLIKPVQRVCKYALLMAELVKYTEQDHPYYQEQVQGLEAIKRAVERVNEAKRAIENQELEDDLKSRVEDWRDMALESYGKLRLAEDFTVMFSTSSDSFIMLISGGENATRELKAYLFDGALFLFKEKESRKRRPSLRLKLKVLLDMLMEVKPQKGDGFFLDITYRDFDSGSNWFTLMCRNEEVMHQWARMIDRLRNRSQINRLQANPKAAAMLGELRTPVPSPERSTSTKPRSASASHVSAGPTARTMERPSLRQRAQTQDLSSSLHQIPPESKPVSGPSWEKLMGNHHPPTPSTESPSEGSPSFPPTPYTDSQATSFEILEEEEEEEGGGGGGGEGERLEEKSTEGKIMAATPLRPVPR
ncbi:uncharacterized protein VTP21DRAFT_4543 [Calcarisporiella thermophila]|uniref:uncharacterized protein n=1 Tax=Calcarisporiella thermophila TaxID=911321 RepID=UPI0037427C21